MYIFEKPDPTLNSNIKFYPHDKIVDWLLVRFLPKSVTPNHLTLLRFILTPPVIYFIVAGPLAVGLILFIIAALTDLLDGVMARCRAHITRWGSIYDPVSDKILIGSVMVILILRHANIYLAWSVIVLELTSIIAGFVLKLQGIIKPASFWGKAKMVLQCFAVGFLLLELLVGNHRLNDIAQILLGVSISFQLMNLYKHGLGL